MLCRFPFGINSELLSASLDDLSSECVDVISKILFIDKIIAANEVRVHGLSSAHMVKQLLGSCCFGDLESRDNQNELEGVGEHVASNRALVLGSGFKLLNHIHDDLHFFLNGDRIEAFVKEDARSMAELNDENVLLDA